MNIHNDIFISTLKKKQNAIDFLEESLPEGILALLDLSSTSYDDTSYVLEEYQELFSDLVLKVKTRLAEPVDIYILLEHKSSRPDGQDLFFQLFSYVYAMYGEDRKNNVKFRQILPLVFYHGEQEWTVPLNFHDVIHTVSDFKPYTPGFSYILYDIADCNTENDQKFQKNILLYSTLAAMKYAFTQGDLKNIKRLLERLHEYGFLRDIIKIEMLLVYVAKTHSAQKDKIIEMIKEIDEEGGLKMLTFAEYFTEQGIEQGIEKGIEQGIEKDKTDIAKKMLSENFDLQTISKITGLPESKIASLQ